MHLIIALLLPTSRLVTKQFETQLTFNSLILGDQYMSPLYCFEPNLLLFRNTITQA